MPPSCFHPSLNARLEWNRYCCPPSLQGNRGTWARKTNWIIDMFQSLWNHPYRTRVLIALIATLATAWAGYLSAKPVLRFYAEQKQKKARQKQKKAHLPPRRPIRHHGRTAPEDPSFRVRPSTHQGRLSPQKETPAVRSRRPLPGAGDRFHRHR